MEGGHYFWLGASANADPATHEPSQPSLSRPSGECPLRDKLVRLISGYGGRCRECADHFGICPKNSLPCDWEERRRAINKVLNALDYFERHPEFLV